MTETSDQSDPPDPSLSRSTAPSSSSSTPTPSDSSTTEPSSSRRPFIPTTFFAKFRPTASSSASVHRDPTTSRQSDSDTSIPPLPPNIRESRGPDLIPPDRPTLAQFRASEGPAIRSIKLKGLWNGLPSLPDISDGPTATQRMRLPGQDTLTTLSPERAERLQKLYEEELVRRVRESRPDASLWGGPDDQEGSQGKGVAWQDFRKFLWDQERELWDIFQEIDRNGDGRLDAVEMRAALNRSGIDITSATVNDLVRFLASGSNSPRSGGPEDMYIDFQEFRDFLIMLPRKATPFEIYKFYQVRKRFSDGRGAARVDKEGDITISFPRADHPSSPPPPAPKKPEDFGDDEDEGDRQDDRHEAWRFLAAGGLAGAVSRSITAPFDRLKIYLITTDDRSHFTAVEKRSGPIRRVSGAMSNLWGAVVRIYQGGGGVRAFWVGNGLNILKITPESAIKFISYEQSKKVLAQYWDRVEDTSELSSSSRFLAGGIGGLTSQFAIYGIETLKTRIQTEMGPNQGMKELKATAKQMWRSGGLRAYYRGLTLGLIGVFPYSAIDMGTYETLKTTYCQSTGKDEPETFLVLSFGALSGCIGAASVYPINLLRTRLQASGSSGHPQYYNGFRDVLAQTLRNEGWRGLYKGLLPSCLKLAPAVSTSWFVYEEAKRRLGV